MVVSCSKCGTKFKIADDKITASGVKVRCSKCKHTFVVSSAGVSEVDAPAPPAQAPPAQAPPTDKAAGAAAVPKAPPQGPLPPPPPTAGVPGSVPPPPAAPEAPLPPPPKVVDSAPPPLAADKFPAPDGDDALPEDIFDSPTKVGPIPTDDAAPARAGGGLPLPPPPPPPPAAVDSAFGSPPASTSAALDEDPFAPMSEGPTQKVPAPPLDGPTVKVPAPAGPSGELEDGLFADLDAAVDETLGKESSAASPPGDLPAPPPPPPPPPARALGGAASDAIPGFEADAPGGQAAAASAPAPFGDDPFAGVELNLPEGPADEAPPMATSAADFMSEAAAANAPSAGAPTSDDPFADIDVAAPSASPAAAAADPFSDIDVSAGAAAPAAAAASADPFADISLDVPAGGAGAEAPAPAGGGMFDKLGDPFAGIGGSAGQAAAAPGGPPPLPDQAQAGGGGSGDDLFGPDEIQMDTGAPSPAPAPGAAADPFAALDAGGLAGGDMDPSVGHDPFGGMDAGDSLALDDGPELGLAMDADGRVGGREPPAPPPPTKSMAGPGQVTAETAPQTISRPPGPPPMAPSAVPDEVGGTSLPVKIGFGLVLLVLALFVFVVYRHGGKPDLTRWSTYVEAFTGRSGDLAVAGDLRARGLTSTTYPNRDGYSLVLLWGEVDNTAKETKSHIVVRGQLLDEKDEVMKELVVPAGVTFGPRDINAMVDDHAVGDAYRARFAEAPKDLAAGASMPFMVILFEHPDDLGAVRVRAVPAENPNPLGGLPSPAPPPADDEVARDAGEGAAAADSAPVALPPKAAANGPKAKDRGAVKVKKSGTVVRFGPKGKAPAAPADPP